MFNRKPKADEDLALDEAIRYLLERLDTVEPHSSEYTTMVKNLEVLYKAKGTYPSRRPSADTIWTIGGSLVSVAMMLTFEKSNVITTKALSFLPKLHF